MERDDPVSGDICDEQVLRVSGNVDFLNGAEFSSALTRAIAACRRIRVDLSETQAMDSRGLTGLVGAYLEAKETGVEISLESVSGNILRILQMSGLAPVFGLAPLRMETARPLPDHSVLNKQDWRITESVVLAEADLVACLREMAVEAAVDAGLDEDAVLDVRLAVGEALVNALQHGSKGPESKIRLRCLSCERAFVVEVTDAGGGGPDVDDSDASTETAGIGMKLMRAAMDEVEFLRGERDCRVRMLKWLSGAACELE